jgi:hypothetical protein
MRGASLEAILHFVVPGQEPEFPGIKKHRMAEIQVLLLPKACGFFGQSVISFLFFFPCLNFFFPTWKMTNFET